MHVRVPIPNLGREPEVFPERDTVDSGVEGHDARGSECPFEQGMGNLAPDTGPTESRAHVEAPHPQRVRDDRIDGNSADGSQHAFRVRGEQGFTGSTKRIAPDAQSLAGRSRSR
jgi:hypothetical protein